jgi:hypothetical protein
MRRILVLLATAALLPPLAVADTILTPAERSGLWLTVTQADQALVRDRRTVTLDKGMQMLVFEGVAPQTQDGSATLSGTGLTVREQAFAPAGLESGRLLSAALGGEVTVVWRDGATTREERATVLAADGVPVFRIGTKVVTGLPERILYDALPAGLRAVPAFTAAITAESGGRREVDLTYLTQGLSWSSDLSAELSPAGDRLTLSSWATITNTSGMDFEAAHLHLLAGDTPQAAPPQPSPRAAKALMAATDGLPAREALGPHHLYTVAQPVSLRKDERRQIALLPPASLAAERRLLLESAPHHAWRGRWAERSLQHPMTQLTVRNSLGQPLPAGTIRVLSRSRDGGLVPISESPWAGLPAGAATTLDLGRAFDVTAKRVQTDFQKVSAEISEAAWEIRLANAGAGAGKVTIRESFGAEWLVLSESAPHVKEDAFSATWTVDVPARGETVLSYRVRVKG